MNGRSMQGRTMSWLDEYSYDLPAASIAQKPSARRDRSRLLVLDRAADTLRHSRFFQLPRYLRRGDLVVLNDTAVRPARLIGRRRDTGGRVELLLLHSLGKGRWRALMRGRARVGMVLDFGDEGIETRILGVAGMGEVTVRFYPPEGGRLLMESKGRPPLPPYIRRGEDTPSATSRSDRVRYQTIFAVREGSVAAPTAGLHFTRELFGALAEKGVQVAFVTLHVGAGTFRPLGERELSELTLEEETAFVPAETAAVIGRTRSAGGRVVAVGTTVTRTLESFAGKEGKVRGGWKKVDLMIRPGYRFRVVDALVTNFHLPRSSLLLLVSALAGREKVLDAYRHALEKGYRFYSYGDAMLVL
jgi:S-adenosylmethionine:tRNA ribosyltransferase-isomerase